MRGPFDDLIEKPFAEYGRGPDAYDCWGAVYASGMIIGEPTPDYADLGHRDLRSVVRRIRETVILPEYEMVRGPTQWAIVLFKILDGEAHFGRMIDERFFIHSLPEMGVHISSIDGIYRRMVKGFFVCRR